MRICPPRKGQLRMYFGKKSRYVHVLARLYLGSLCVRHRHYRYGINNIHLYKMVNTININIDLLILLDWKTNLSSIGKLIFQFKMHIIQIQPTRKIISLPYKAVDNIRIHK